MELKQTFAAALLAAAALYGAAAPACADEERVYKVGSEPYYAPFEYIDEKTGEMTGFDIDLIKTLAKVAGIKIEIKPMHFDDLIPALDSDELDCAISSITITEERATKVSFSQPYFKAGIGMLIHKDFADSIKGAADLKGHKICVQKDTSDAEYAATVQGAELKTFTDTPDAYAALDRKECDVILNDRPPFAYYLKTAKPENMVLLPDYLSEEEYGIMLNKNNVIVAQLLDDAFDKIKADGTYDKIYAKYFGD